MQIPHPTGSRKPEDNIPSTLIIKKDKSTTKSYISGVLLRGKVARHPGEANTKVYSLDVYGETGHMTEMTSAIEEDIGQNFKDFLNAKCELPWKLRILRNLRHKRICTYKFFSVECSRKTGVKQKT